MNTIINEALHFLFPAYCVRCGARLGEGRRFICSHCFESLPKYVGLDLYYGGSEQLSGLVPFTEYQASLVFTKQNATRKLIHKIKYNGFPKLGYDLAHHFAPRHLELGHFVDISMVVPIPLLKERLKRRGYNQSAYIAKGLAEVYHLPVEESVLQRKDGHGTQTRKGKEGRWSQTKGAFSVPEGVDLTGRRVLVVDDVMTTGATLTQAGRAVLDAGAESISFYTLAFDDSF